MKKSLRRDLSEPPPGVLVLAVLFENGFLLQDIQDKITKTFGEIFMASTPFKFTQTSYYEAEMGRDLIKVFFAIRGGFSRDAIVGAKKSCVEFENRYLNESLFRRINIDPMLVTVENVVVASSKNFPHRVYLCEGVFADLQLLRRRSGFEGLAWTYQDYIECKDFFERVSQSSLPNAGLAED